MNEQDRADLSAFFDEEPVDLDRAIRLLNTDAGRDAWERQCLVRDALRGEPLAGASCDMVSRVRSALADEPVIFNPGARAPTTGRDPPDPSP